MADGIDVNGEVKEFLLKEFLPGEDPADLTDDLELYSSGILDSLATLKLVAFLEKHFNITIAAHEADKDNLHTVAQIVKLVDSKQ